MPTTNPLLGSGLLKASMDTISADSENNATILPVKMCVLKLRMPFGFNILNTAEPMALQ